MAQPRKLATANAGARSQAAGQAASQAAPARTAPKTSSLRTTLAIFALFCIVGAIPAALGGETFGYWRLPITSAQLASPPWSLSYDTPLATSTPMLANATLRVVVTSGGGTVGGTFAGQGRPMPLVAPAGHRPADWSPLVGPANPARRATSAIWAHSRPRLARPSARWGQASPPRSTSPPQARATIRRR
jgi:hypothetical protein